MWVIITLINILSDKADKYNNCYPPLHKRYFFLAFCRVLYTRNTGSIPANVTRINAKGYDNIISSLNRLTALIASLNEILLRIAAVA